MRCMAGTIGFYARLAVVLAHLKATEAGQPV